ncbi:uncharacterized protein N7503_004744 [Penicillium pulvis]|uniref:uncharacterized protein n=1 Tax=Penicillium pulvis TaxID=1562058 RepID=UPI0025496718|nr:uncharacterized protein N7503_004744 [Penicillium pulvis]KAJ5802294.1 hypothetical protein N7503_004744 [Penicillium pulvis]
MPDPTKLPRKRPPSPQNCKRFDAWNSSSTGHQRHKAGYAGTATWRDTRSLKLERQFRSGDCLREEDSVPSSRSRAFDGTCGSPTDDQNNDQENEHEADRKKNSSFNGHGEWRWVNDAEAKRSQLGVRDIRSFMGVGKRKSGDDTLRPIDKKQKVTSHAPLKDTENRAESKPIMKISPTLRPSNAEPVSAKPNLFVGTTMFINGSTLPSISDHKLKRLLVDHGAQISIHMARKTVSHVIIGQPNAIFNEATLGAGGGLSARKLQQEIARGGWKGVRIVGVEWVLESIKAGQRLAESRFTVLNVAPKGQQSVAGMFGRK